MTNNTLANNKMDSRIASMMLNINFGSTSYIVANKYAQASKKINETHEPKKVYRSLRQTIKESYLSGSLLYGNNFIS